MFRITKEYGETPEGKRLVSGDAMLTVTKVEGTKVTGWFYTEWWRDEVAVALLRNTECLYGTDEEWLDATDNGNNDCDCPCAACQSEGDYDRHWADFHAEMATVEVPTWWERWESRVSEGDRLMVSGIFTTEELEGSDDRHGVTAGGSSTTYCGTVRWTEWNALHLYPWHKKVALYRLADHANA